MWQWTVNYDQPCGEKEFSLRVDYGQYHRRLDILVKRLSRPPIFFLMINIKETQELSNHIRGELKLDPKGFTLVVQTKVCQNDLAPQ